MARFLAALLAAAAAVFSVTEAAPYYPMPNSTAPGIPQINGTVPINGTSGITGIKVPSFNTTNMTVPEASQTLTRRRGLRNFPNGPTSCHNAHGRLDPNLPQTSPHAKIEALAPAPDLVVNISNQDYYSLADVKLGSVGLALQVLRGKRRETAVFVCGPCSGLYDREADRLVLNI
ncbi:hypothetical protein F4780DRAFT_778756 [Xylariomycetidae sp. FL0641]|nr:hypothetical protein F4780DRAFT_778756 [Xylariomycetidae sp. FL0641]